MTACHQGVVDDAVVGGECPEEQLVTIRTYIQNSSPALRAGETTWHPQSVGALPFEEAIYNAVLYVYRGTTLEKCMIYYTEAYGKANPSLPGLGPDRARMITPAVIDGVMELSMEIELYPGTYNFIVVVNSEQAIAQAKAPNDGISGINPFSIVYTGEATNAFTSWDIDPNSSTTGIPSKMLPMVGEQTLKVPFDIQATSPTNRHQLMPKIALERVHARLEVTLNIPEQQVDEKGNVLSPFYADQYRLGLVELYGIGGYDFPLLPQQGERTAIDKLLLLNSGALTVPAGAATLVNYLNILSTDTDFEAIGFNQPTSGTMKGTMTEFSFTPLLIHKTKANNNVNYQNPSVDKEKQVGVYIYFPPLYRTESAPSVENQPTFAPHLKLRFDPPAHPNKEATYLVYLHNETHEGGTGTPLAQLPKDFWSIRRNTIYQLPLTFEGKELVVKYTNNVWVKAWKEEPLDTVVADLQ